MLPNFTDAPSTGLWQHLMFTLDTTFVMAWRLVHDLQRRQLRRERVFRDRTNPLDSLNDQQLLEQYRFRRNDIMWLTDEFGAELEH